MQITFNCAGLTFNKPKYKSCPAFGTNARIYKTQTGIEMGTLTYPFRDDVDWKKLTEYEINHFKNHDRVNIIQFASSDGSEAYSKIISFLERGNNKNIDKFFPIKAYDIDEEIVRAANSGFLNIRPENMKYIFDNCSGFDKYFMPTSHKLDIQNDFFDFINTQYRTFRVSDTLKNRVIFNHADMYDILYQINDNSDTILMCRNVLGYFSESQIKNTIEIVSRKLKEGSLFIIGSLDTDDKLTGYYLKNNKFIEVMKNVFRKI